MFGKRLLILGAGLMLVLVSMQSMYGSYALVQSSGMMQSSSSIDFDPNAAKLRQRGWMQTVVDLRIQIAKV